MLNPFSSGEAEESVKVTLCQTSTPSLTTGHKLKPGQAAEHTTVYTGLFQVRAKGCLASLVKSLNIRRAFTRPILYNQESERVILLLQKWCVDSSMQLKSND
jgi:hypothetical protein